MIDLKYTIDSKPIVSKKDGTTILDLTAPSLKQNVSFVVLDYFFVRKIEEMRPDLLAQRYYGNMVNTEMLLKLNGVSNPFSIEEGDIFIISDPVTGRTAMINNAVVNRGDIRKQYFQPEKEGKPDPKLKVFDNRQVVKPNKKKTGQTLPPNFANIGDKELEIVGGKIIFGTNVSKGGTGVADVPLEKQKFLDGLTNNADVKKVVKLSDTLLPPSSENEGFGTGIGSNGTNQGNVPAASLGLGTDGLGGFDTTPSSTDIDPSLTGGSGAGNSTDIDPSLTGGSGAGNNTGVPGVNLTAAEKKKKDDQAALTAAKNEKLAAVVNVAKSDVIAKLVKKLYGKI